ncbi:MAG TPA: thymidine phosphorylase [Armatimonadota bacterium]|nr:thymidine phosphorylase [Armatimonadota bacterium]
MAFTVHDILYAKRKGLKHSSEEIKSLVNGYVAGDVADYQVSAWLMAACINGLDSDETSALTQGMVDSGETIDLSSLGGTTVDKHSTGGIGDKTTLVLVPLLASASLTVAKMSGRGLGITGGTIDKLESIPGFSVNLSKEQFLDQARRIGCVVAGQTANLAPADKKIYALRDVTATVDCIPLIAASVMSKKIASGAKTILLDVKSGSGAFMKDIESARELADTMIDIGRAAGRRTIAVISDMDQPLGLAVGNSVEVAEAIDTLKGNGPSDLTELCIELASLLCNAACPENGISRTQIEELLSSGAALLKFRQMIEAQDGDSKVLDDTSLLPQAKFSLSVYAKSSGYITAVDAERIGRAACLLGAGRSRKEDQIDPTAGVLLRKKIGDQIEAGEELAVLVWSGNISPEPAVLSAESAFSIGAHAPESKPLIQDKLGF